MGGGSGHSECFWEGGSGIAGVFGRVQGIVGLFGTVRGKAGLFGKGVQVLTVS